MLIALLLACAADLTDYRGGWREVECDPGNRDADGWIVVDIDGEPVRPMLAYTKNGDLWESMPPFVRNGTISITNADVDACRLWVAE